MMIHKRLVQLWSCWLFVVIQQIHSSTIPTQLMSLCNQTLHLSSSLSMIFTPTLSSSSFSTCCNVSIARASSNLSELIFVNVNQMFTNSSSLKIFDEQMKSVDLTSYSTWNRTLMKTNILRLPTVFSLCRFDSSPFEIFVTKISKGPCASNEFSCSDQWCIDETFHCDGFHSCPNGFDETNCQKIHTRIVVPKMTRTIRGGVVTTIIIFGLLLIISSVSIAVVFLYFRRKRQRRRQFTYSLESTSDDWEPSGTGYHLFDNWTTHRRSPVPNDVNEHVPITTIISNR